MQHIQKITLAELRKSVGNVKQSVVALEMNVQEPAISKMERKHISDTNLNKLERYVQALGGSIKIEITLPNGNTLDEMAIARL